MPAAPLASDSIDYVKVYGNHQNTHKLFNCVLLFLERVIVNETYSIVK